MKKRRLYFSLVLGLILSLFSTCPVFSPLPSMAAEQSGIPNMIGIGTLRVGGAGHLMASTLGEVFQKKQGLKARVVPVDSDFARVALLRSGEIQFEVNAGSQMYPIQLGLADYCKLDWGPQPLQMAWLGPAYLAVITTKTNKDINTLADIKGKRVAWMPLRSSQILHEAFLAFAGLRKEDIKAIPVDGYVGQFMALMAGKVDVVLTTNPVTSKLVEVDARPAGMKWLPLPRENKEGWKRLREIAPWGVPSTITVGVGISKEKPVEGYDHFYGFAVYENTSPDLVYLLTKTIAENLEELHRTSQAWKVYTMEKALETEMYPHVYHRGAVKYFKEKGLWKDAHEKKNQMLLGQQEKLIAAWKPLLAKAQSEKWALEQLRERWYGTQQAITGFRPID